MFKTVDILNENGKTILEVAKEINEKNLSPRVLDMLLFSIRSRYSGDIQLLVKEGNIIELEKTLIKKKQYKLNKENMEEIVIKSIYHYIETCYIHEASRVSFKTVNGKIYLSKYIGLSKHEIEQFVGVDTFDNNFHKEMVYNNIKPILLKSLNVIDNDIVNQKIKKSDIRNIFYFEVDFLLGNDLLKSFDDICEKAYSGIQIDKLNQGDIIFKDDMLEISEKIKTEISVIIKNIDVIQKRIDKFLKR